MFILHERLRSDAITLGRLELSLLLLMNDKSLPWFILVPEKEELGEIHELQQSDRSMLIEEIAFVSAIIRKIYNPSKINIGALGNLVPQLHVHVVGRFKSDRAWPGPIWGTGPIEPYATLELMVAVERIKEAMKGRLK